MPRRVDDFDAPPRRPRAKGGASTGLWVGLSCVGALLGLAVVAVGAVVFLIVRRPSGPTPAPHGPAAVTPPAVGPPTVPPPAVPPPAAAAGEPKALQVPFLVAYWPFDDAPSGQAADLSGHGNNATLVGGAGLGEGKRGRGLRLDGQPGRYADLGTGKDLNFGPGEAFTFAGWYRTPQASATILSLRHSQGGPQQIDLLLRDNRLIIVVGDDGDPGTLNAFVWSKRPNDGRWHHFAFTRHGGLIELFLDGEPQGSMVANHSGGPITTDRRALGCERAWADSNDRRWGNPYFQGDIDEVCVFRRVLPPADVKALMDRGPAGP